MAPGIFVYCATKAIKPIDEYQIGETNYGKHIKIEYKWYEIVVERDPFIKKTPYLTHSGKRVKYSEKALALSGWNPSRRFPEGTTYIYCKAFAYYNGYLWARTPDFVPVGKTELSHLSRDGGGNYQESKDSALQAIKRAHKIICGDYNGQQRGFRQWAITHVGLPYCFGAQDRYVGEDCAGLVLGAGVQSGKPIKYDACNNWKNNPSTHGLVQVGKGSGGSWSAQDQSAFWTIMSQITAADLERGVLVFHSKSFATLDRATHVVIVNDINLEKKKVSIIEAQGWDDETAGHLRNPRGNLNDAKFNSSAEEVTSAHDYVTEYLARQQDSGKSYVGNYWVFKFIQ